MAKRAEALSFDRIAAEYESTRPLPTAIAERLARRCVSGLRSEVWYLDAGAGTGRIGRSLAARHPRTIGLDVSPEMLARATGMHRALGDIRNLPFPTGAFAGVLTVHLLHLVPEWQAALTELWRVVAPGGKLVLGFEERASTVTRELYQSLALARGLDLTRSGGVQSDVLKWLPKLGGTVEIVRPTELAWSSATTVLQTLGGLEKRLYSALWEIPEETHQELLAETRRQALDRLGSERYTEVAEIQFLLAEVRKPI